MLALGAPYMEVRSAWGVNVVELDDAQVARLKSIPDAAGLKVSAVASPIGKVDVALPAAHEITRLGRIIEVAQTLETRYIRKFSNFRAEDQTPEDIRDAIMERLSLLAAWDNANFVQVGVKPYTYAYAMVGPYLVYLQVKDAMAGSGEVVPTGRGDEQLVETLAALSQDGYTGFASLEPHLAAQHELGGFSGPAAFGEALLSGLSVFLVDCFGGLDVLRGEVCRGGSALGRIGPLPGGLSQDPSPILAGEAQFQRSPKVQGGEA